VDGAIDHADDVVAAFHRRYAQSDAWFETHWLGIQVLKCPLDLWMYQEILFRTRPDVIVETGTWKGGSALFLASICDLLGSGRIVTIDINEMKDRPSHPRITYVRGSSTDLQVLAHVRRDIDSEDRVMVILDCDHSEEHVLTELKGYGPLVSEDCYLIVEDTPTPGATEAIQEFLGDNPSFVVDKECEKFLMTFQPGGYLRRQATDPVTNSAAARGELRKRKVKAKLWERAVQERFKE
jgi:cephalosporin hydroxylase